MKLLVIDGNSILNRAFYGIKLLSNKKGVFTNAVTGFFNIYLKLISAYKPDGAAVAFDMKAPTFRHMKYEAYKAGRKGMPDELHMQMPYVKEILKALGIRVLECEGWEADDILGTLARACEESGSECIVATGDRDSFQLVSDKVSVNLASNKEDILYTPEKIMEVYGVTPPEMIEVKALMGDSSDNIPGVPGIGEKTALALIGKYHSIDNIYADIEAVEAGKSAKEKLIKGEESARLSRWLGTIARNAPVDTDVEGYRFGEKNEQKLAELLTELEMFTMLKKLNVSANAAASKPEAPKEEAAVTAELDASVADYILYNEKLYKCVGGKASEVSAEELSDDKPKRTFDLKSIISALGTEPKNVVFDTTLAAYLLDVSSSEYTLERLCAEYGTFFADGTPDELAAVLYNLNCAVYGKLKASGMEKLMLDIEIPLSYVLVSMEKEGVAIDRNALEEFGRKLTSEEQDLEQEIYVCAGRAFNIASPKQLGTVLFDELMLPSGKKTKTGYSTNADVLESLRGKHPIIELILRYRAVTKLNSTYAQGLLKVIADDGRIHTTYKQTETRTGRISSVEPNIQNIPVRTERGREFRRFFTAREGYTLVDADYSQIELRILAHISDDRNMIEAFRSGTDIHTVTASQVFNIPVEEVTPDMRRSAKAVNFGIVYGIGAFSLSKDINVSVAQADDYIKSYLSTYSGVDSYMKKITESGKNSGYVSTMFGRRRYIPELSASNKNVQALGKRIAMNTPIQGSAADIIKLAMIKVHKRLKDEQLDAKLILQVHDELIVEAESSIAEKAAEILREEMENVADLAVKLIVDAKCGKTWYEAH